MINLSNWLTLLMDSFTFYGGGKGSKSSAPAPTNTTVQNTNIPEYAKPYVQTMLGAAQSEIFDVDSSGNVTNIKPYVPYSTNAEDYVAGFSPLQQQSFDRAAGLAMPGQFDQATQLGGAAGLGSLGLAGQAAGAGQQFQQMATNPNAVQAYMNPYLESSLAPQLDMMRRQYNITAQDQQSRATGAGAFGGSREALMASENERAKNAAIDQTLSKGYFDAFNNAQNQMQYGAGLNLQGLSAGLSGLGQAGSIAGGLGSLGTNQLAAQQGIINSQNLMGTQQQQQQQNIINQSIQDYATAQQYPMMQLANMSNLTRGLPMQSTSTQAYQAAPSALSQVAGLGSGIAGAAMLMKAKGGMVKSYAGGGITSLDNRESIAEDLSVDQLEKVQPRTLPDYIKVPMIAERIRQQQPAARPQNQPSIKDIVMAQAESQGTGIDAAQSNYTPTMAQGGIVAFAEGGVGFDTTELEEMRKLAYNPETNKMYTREEIAARQEAEREKRGIKDIYTGQLEDLKGREEALEGKKDRALGLGLLSASGKMLSSTSPNAFAGIGEGLGEFASTYGKGLEGIDKEARELNKDEQTLLLAQQGMKQAQMDGDEKAFRDNESVATAAALKIAELKNKEKELIYDREGKLDIAKIEANAKIAAANIGKSASAGNTSLRTSIAERNKFIVDGINQIDEKYETALSNIKLKNPEDLTPKDKALLTKVKKEKEAVKKIYTGQFNDIIKNQASIEGYSAEEIGAMLRVDPVNETSTQKTKSGTTYEIIG